eukprot:TRINITY_DN10879_c0_g1_i1.p1 TRINITY_DN10879_c0_g1~~TRINITY_DN10879_c0_g1_i1.p1  ORF type:complete len:416 (-),score=89.29 TRINITY_DN10879_c0_g1_i1:14-1261(-)
MEPTGGFTNDFDAAIAFIQRGKAQQLELLEANKNLQNQLGIYREQGDRMKLELENLKRELNRAQAENRSLSNTVAAKDEEIRTMRIQNESLRDAERNSRVRLEQANKAALEASRREKECMMHLDRIRQERNTCRHQLEQTAKEIAGLKAEIEKRDQASATRTTTGAGSASGGQAAPMASPVSVLPSVAVPAKAVAMVKRLSDGGQAAFDAAFPRATRDAINDLKRSQKRNFRNDANSYHLRRLAHELSDEIDVSAHLFIEMAAQKCGNLNKLMETLLSFSRPDIFVDLASINLTQPLDFPKLRLITKHIAYVQKRVHLFTSDEANAAAAKVDPSSFADAIAKRNDTVHRAALLQFSAVQKFHNDVVAIVGSVAAICAAPGSYATQEIGQTVLSQIGRLDKWRQDFVALFRSSLFL